MSKRIGNIFYATPEPPRMCEMCEEVEECRPYGPNGEQICYKCGMLNKETTEKKIDDVLSKVDVLIIGDEEDVS